MSTSPLSSCVTIVDATIVTIVGQRNCPIGEREMPLIRWILWFKTLEQKLSSYSSMLSLIGTGARCSVAAGVFRFTKSAGVHIYLFVSALSQTLLPTPTGFYATDLLTVNHQHLIKTKKRLPTSYRRYLMAGLGLICKSFLFLLHILAILRTWRRPEICCAFFHYLTLNQCSAFPEKSACISFS